jgi:hypothetical protein
MARSGFLGGIFQVGLGLGHVDVVVMMVMG